MQPQVFAGYRTVLKINNDIVGAGFVIDYTIDTSEVTISGVDNVVPSELAPDKIQVTMNIRVYRTADNDPVSNLIAPLGDNAHQLDAFTKSPYISVEIRDKTTDKTIVYLPRAFLFRRSGSVDAENLLVETWSIKSIGFYGPGSQNSGLAGSLEGVLGANPVSAFLNPSSFPNPPKTPILPG
jgi:hypothetical protein